MPALNQRRPRLRAAVRRNAMMAGAFPAIALTWATPGCSPTAPDCFGIRPGNRVAITVNGLQGPPVSPDACGFGFDMTQGLTLVATDLGNPDTSSLEGSTCNAAYVAIDPFADWTWTTTGSPGGTAPTVLTGYFNVTNGTCTGTASLHVVAEDGLPFAAADAGQGPVVMERRFAAQGDGGAGCPSVCSDAFLVTLQRL
jgi:hypothetical protein